MRIEDFLALLRGVRPNGERSWVACCPAHDDRNPSMSVTERDGKILVHCHAGCSVDEICAALGIQKKDLFMDERPGRFPRPTGARSVSDAESFPGAGRSSTSSKKKSGGHGRLVCEYIYRAEDGAALFKVQRRVLENGKKTFIAFRPDETARGGWAFGIHDKSGGREKLMIPYSAPYHLPQLVEAGRAGRAIVIVEGEKDVETVESLGIVSTCNPFGSGKWGKDWPDDWGKWFAGIKSIFIVADKDPETFTRTVRGKEVTKPFLVGQKHAWDVRNKLKAAGVSAMVRLVCMPDVNGRPVKDFTDWVMARQAEGLPCDKKAFLAAVAEFGEWPDAWCFTDEQVAEGAAAVSASARAEKNGARAAASPDSPDSGDSAGDDAGEIIRERFGRRRRPRTPAEDVEIYEVDYKLSGNRFVRIEARADAPLQDCVAIMCGRVRKKLVDDEKLTGEMVREVQVVVTVMWLRSRGWFFWDENFKSFETSMFFDRKRGELLYLREAEFLTWISSETGENREGRTFKFIMAAINDAAISPDVSRGTVPAVAWDRRGDAVYISSGDSEMWRVRAGKIEKVQNGVDGVVMARRRTLAPWKLVDGPGVDPFATAKAFAGASWADAASGPMNVRLWVLNLFACHRMKPGLLITGPFQGGKTRMALAIKQVLGMTWDGDFDKRISRMQDGDAGEDAFWVTIDAGRLEIFDNVDSKVKWMGDALQMALTDGCSPRRKKYSDREMITLRANASVILTSNNPMFATEGGGGLADRLITVHLSAPKERESLDVELTAEIRQHRNEYMTWIVRTLARALADDSPVDKAINRRHPEYGRFSVRCGRAFGNETGVVGALGVAEADKSLLPLMNDRVTYQILRVLADHDWRWKYTAAEMSEAIITGFGDQVDEKTQQVYSPKRVGNAMSKFMRQLASLLNFGDPRILHGRTIYQVYGPRGVAACALLARVCRVGNVGESQETRTKEETREVVPIPRANTPNPPLYVRDDPSPHSDMEEGEDIETLAEMEGQL